MVTRKPQDVRQWMREGTAVFARYASALDEDAARAPSLLRGWTRAHIMAHLARNAEGLRRLADWARTGVETPMYAGPAQRKEEIEATAGHDIERLKSDLSGTNAMLEEGLAALGEQQWINQVRTAQGRLVPATEIPWMRVREVWLHAVDLDTGFLISDIPDDVVDALLDNVTTIFDTRPDAPALTLTANDRPATWTIHADDDPFAVSGAAADLLGWLIGRSGSNAVTGAGTPHLPEIPRWL
jgi:maleylpyruvate isomerase